MVKAPSSHGLDRKYKSWRKGKSQHSKRRGSLKQQLRGLERSLKRAKDDSHRQGLEEKIKLLKAEIAGKQEVEKERQNAKQSHGTRFLERQKLVRMERNTRNNPNLSKQQKEKELLKIALDQVYVAHYPMELKYFPLFRQGVRRVDPAKVLGQRASTRRRILAENFAKGKQPSGGVKSWISEDQYKRVALISEREGEWSKEREREIFGEESAKAGKTEEDTADDRFAAPSQHEALLAAAEQAEVELDKQDDTREEKEIEDKLATSSDDAQSSSDESLDEADPLKPNKKRKRTEKEIPLDKKAVMKSRRAVGKDDASSASGSSSDDDSSTSSSSSSSDDDSSSDSSGSDGDEESRAVQPEALLEKTNDPVEVMMEDDDFLVPAVESSDNVNVFAKPKERISAVEKFTGDKSKGWATQRQRPGQFKKQNSGGRERRRW